MRAESEVESGPITSSPSGVGDLAAAMVKAQAKFTSVSKTKTAKVPLKSGGSYSYRYADLADIWDMIRKPLSEAGIAVFQPVETHTAHVVVTTVLIHAGTGQTLSCAVSMPTSQAGAQGLGSAITYARRYGLGSMLGIVTEEDDDAQVADGAAPAPSETPKEQANTTPKQQPRAKSGQTARGAQVAAKMKPLEPVGETFKGKSIRAMTPDELSGAIREAEGFLLTQTATGGQAASGVREKIAALEAELRRREDEAAELALGKG